MKLLSYPSILGEGRVYEAARQIGGGGSIVQVLGATPGQQEDIYRILVDDRVVVGFELRRNDREMTPLEVKVWSVRDYRKEIGQGRARAMLEMALELARGERAKCEARECLTGSAQSSA